MGRGLFLVSSRPDERLRELHRLRADSSVQFGEAHLTIELVPSTSWYSNVRSQVSSQEWDRLRRPVYRRANWRCEICGGRGQRHAVECHEVWYYDDAAQIQRLEGLIALCPACHEVKHIGRTSLMRGDEAAIMHLAVVNEWTVDRADAYVDLALDIWKLRSELSWRLDLSWLAAQGVVVPEE